MLDCSPLIRKEHLLAALAVWDYAEDSARYIFGAALGNPVADELLDVLRSRPEGLTRTEIRDLFGRHKKTAPALVTLAAAGLARCEQVQTGGRPEERWFAVTP
jgi:hypothetical protein